MDMIDLFFRTDSQIVEMHDREISSRTKPGTFSAIFLPHTNDCAWLAIVATLIVFVHACGSYSRATTISFAELIRSYYLRVATNWGAQGCSQDFRKEGARLCAKRTKILDRKSHPLIKSCNLEYSRFFVPLNSSNAWDSRPDTARSKHSSKFVYR